MDKEKSVDKCSKMEEEELLSDPNSEDQVIEGDGNGDGGSSSDSSSSEGDGGEEEENESASASSSEDDDNEEEDGAIGVAGGSKAQRKPEAMDGGTQDKETKDERETTVEDLRDSLAQANARADLMEEENGRLHRELELFRKWEGKIRKWEEEWNKKMLLKRELRQWSKEVEKWEGTLEGLRKSMEEVNEKWQGKEREILGLTRKLEKLRGSGLGLGSVPTLKTLEPRQVGGRDPILIFPEEVWGLIIGQLTDPKDLWNCTNTCQLFEKVLRQWKTSWMFEQAFPHLFRDLPKDKILECRLVSKGWNKVVDQFFEEHLSLRPHDHEQDKPVDRRILPFVNPLVEKGFDKVNVVSFTSESGPGVPSVPSRIIGRALTLSILLNETDDDLAEGGGLCNVKIFENVKSFLRAYGRDIWYLTFKIILGENPGESVKEKVVRFLIGDLKPLVANLRKLCVRVLPFQRLDFDRTLEFASWPKKLETIDLVEVRSTRFSVSLVVANILSGGQLRRLDLLAPEYEFLSAGELAGLTELHLKFVSEDTLTKLVDSREKIPQLRLLALDLDTTYNGSFDLVLDTVTKLSIGTRLRTLQLRVNIWSGIFRTMRSNLCLPPTLTTVELEVDHLSIRSYHWSCSSYSFLLRFPFVENLHLFCRKSGVRGVLLQREIGLLPESEFEDWGTMRQGDREEFLQVNKYMFRKQMYKSNIWKLLPRLKLFSFQWDVSTRAEYEQFIEKMEKSERI